MRRCDGIHCILLRITKNCKESTSSGREHNRGHKGDIHRHQRSTTGAELHVLGGC